MSSRTVTTSHCIIIGAGAAGLSAAARLGREKNLTVTILEATNRVGGRVVNTDFPNCKVGLGASWLHETRNNVLFDLAVEQGWPMKYTDVWPALGTNRGILPENNGIVPILDDLNHIISEKFHNISWRAPAREEPSMESFANSEIDAMPLLTSTERRLAKLMVKEFEHFVALPLSDIPVQDCGALTVQGRDAYLLNDGIKVIIDWIHSQINWNQVTMNLSTPVSAVELAPSGEFSVLADGKEFRAPYVLCTIPLGALKSSFDDIFSNLPQDESLTAVRETVRRTSSGSLGKVIIEFSVPFWNQKHDSFFVSHETENKCASIINPLGNNVLMILTGPPLTEQIETDPTNAISYIGWALEAIALPGKAVTEVVAMSVSNWTQSPWSKGSYSARSLGQSFDDLVAGYIYNEGRLRFAGEHTILEGNGCVHGAYESGIREAETILSMMQKD